jgi:hypothetical protein
MVPVLARFCGGGPSCFPRGGQNALTPEQSVVEAIACVREILAEVTGGPVGSDCQSHGLR